MHSRVACTGMRPVNEHHMYFASSNEFLIVSLILGRTFNLNFSVRLIDNITKKLKSVCWISVIAGFVYKSSPPLNCPVIRRNLFKYWYGVQNGFNASYVRLFHNIMRYRAFNFSNHSTWTSIRSETSAALVFGLQYIY